MKTSLDHLPERKRAQLAAIATIFGPSELTEARLLEAEARGEARGEAKGKAEGLREGKEEGLREGEAKGLREGEAKGLREGKAEGLRAAVLDLCEVLGIEVTAEQRAQLDAMGVGELEALRQALKTTRRWPGPGP
jgi:flagellar biosynthesis/type III secretory pathway protein FliH